MIYCGGKILNKPSDIKTIDDVFVNLPECKPFTMDDFKKALETINKTFPRTYSSVCIKCRKSFVSSKPINNFLECEDHENNKDYIMIKPLR